MSQESHENVSNNKSSSSEDIEDDKSDDNKSDVSLNEKNSVDLGAECDQPLVYLDDDTLKLNEHIEKRIRALQKIMLILKRQLTEEKEAWKKEVDELAQLQSGHCDCDYESYYSTSKVNSNSDSYYREPTVSESVIDYEHKLSQYEKTLRQVQNEKRYQIRRQMAESAYKKRLLEVENMCNMELLRLKQTFQFLQPLQQFIIDGDFQRTDSGDASSFFSVNNNYSLSQGSETIDSNYPLKECIGSKLFSDISKNKLTKNLSESSTQVENLNENEENSMNSD